MVGVGMDGLQCTPAGKEPACVHFEQIRARTLDRAKRSICLDRVADSMASQHPVVSVASMKTSIDKGDDATRCSTYPASRGLNSCGCQVGAWGVADLASTSKPVMGLTQSHTRVV